MKIRLFSKIDIYVSFFSPDQKGDNNYHIPDWLPPLTVNQNIYRGG